jgi:hypothetical protein
MVYNYTIFELLEVEILWPFQTIIKIKTLNL